MKALKIIFITVLIALGMAIYYIGYRVNLVVQIPKEEIETNFPLTRIKHFQDRNLTTEHLTELMKTSTPKIFVFWTGWCEYSTDFLSKTDSIYIQYPNIKFVFINLDKESNLEKSDSFHLFYNLKEESYRMQTDNKFMDFANHKSIHDVMRNINSNFENDPGLPYFIGTGKNGQIISEIAGYEGKETLKKIDNYLTDFNIAN